MTKDIRKRPKLSYLAKTPEGRKRQIEGRKKRWPKGSKTRPDIICKIKEQSRPKNGI